MKKKNELKLLKDENRRLPDKVVLMTEEKGQESHKSGMREDKLGLKEKKEMKQSYQHFSFDFYKRSD